MSEPVNDRRTLSFPDDRTIGRLTISVGSEREEKPARGAVEVPVGATVMLQLAAPEGATDFSAGDVDGLSALAPDDLLGLHTADLRQGAGPAIARLKGLAQLSLSGAVDDEDLAAVAALPALDVITVQSEAVTGAGFSAVGDRALKVVTVNLPALTSEGFRAIASLRVEYLVVGSSTVTAETLDAAEAVRATSLILLAETVAADAVARLVERSPDLTSISVNAPDYQTSLLDDATVLALRRANPALTVNGTWYAPKMLEKLAAARGA
jgi:hypothetical protein